MILLKHRAGRMKRGSRGQDLNQQQKGEASDSEVLNLGGCERWEEAAVSWKGLVSIAELV